MKTDLRALHPDYLRALPITFIGQVSMGLLTAMILDGGYLYSMYQISLVAFWVPAVLVLWFHPSQPPRWAPAYLRWGIVPVFVATAFIVTACFALRQSRL